MKKDILVFSFVFLINCDMMGQKHDSVPARSLAEKGAQGDVHLGNEIRKDKLLDAPQRLPVADSSPRTDIHSKKKKNKPRKI
jgi:hypothetical protein